MTTLDHAKAAYFAAFKQHPFNTLTDSLPPEKVTQMIGEALNNSEEWLDYQNAWLAVHGVKTVLVQKKPFERNKKNKP